MDLWTLFMLFGALVLIAFLARLVIYFDKKKNG